MYILDVIPTIKIPKTDLQVLSYFSSVSVPRGALVRVPVGRQQLNALVLGVQPLSDQKFALKKSSYQIKNIVKVLSEEPVLNAHQIALLQYCADYYMASLPLFLKTFLPNYLIAKKTPIALAGAPAVAPASQTSQKPLLIMQDDRIESYRQLVRETIASGRQVLVLAPETAIAHFWMEQLEEYHPLLLTSELTPKVFFTAWNKIRANDAQCIVGTRAAVFANFQDLGLVIIDEEQNPHYKSWDMLPYYHTRTVALELARLHGARVVLGSATPSVAAYWHAKQGAYELQRGKKHPQEKKAGIIAIDMRNEMLDKNYSLFSYQLKNALEELLSHRDKKALLFISRRGTNSFYFCADCKNIVACRQCDTHMVYHKSRNLLVCHICGSTSSVPLKCPKCSGSNIKMFGAGTQRVVEEIEKLFGYRECVMLDTDTAKTHKEQRNIVEKYMTGDSRIMVTTHAALYKPLLREHADLLCVVSLDNMLYIPDYSIGERLYQTIAGLSQYRAPDAQFFVQTYTPENEILQRILAQNYDIFYENEIAVRREWRYPPFARIIKLTLKDKTKASAQKNADMLAGIITDLAGNTKSEIDILGPAPAYIPKANNLYIFQIIVKIISGNKLFYERFMENTIGIAVIDIDPEHLI